MKNTLYAALLSLILAATVSAPALGKIAIIVNADAPVNDLSLGDLERLFLGKRSLLFGDEMVRLAGQGAICDPFCAVATGLSTRRFRKHWIKEVFAGNRIEPPELMDNARDVVRWVADDIAAIAFVDASVVSDAAGIKAVSIDGRSLQDAEYPFP